jgi:glycosyltransferase involved in cell wall biosynthesis
MPPEVAGGGARPPPVLAVVVPCFNEEAVLPETARRLSEHLDTLTRDRLIDARSVIVFVDDGSLDRTWQIVEELSLGSPRIAGLKLSRNQGHQNALLSGLLTAAGDVLITIDADLQDDPAAIREMLLANRAGADIVYGVRSSRAIDSIFKRMTAKCYYKLLKLLGADVIFNHADFRLMSRRAVESLRDFGEVNLFLRGIIPQLGFRTAIVEYDRQARLAGESKYSIRQMLSLAFEGLTSLSTRPLRWITFLGLWVSMLSFVLGAWALGITLSGTATAPGWASTVVPLSFLSGIQLFSLGVIGEYLGKVYLEIKRRPRFIVERMIGAAFIDQRSQLSSPRMMP